MKEYFTLSAFEFENLKTIENYSEFDDEGYSVHKIDKKRYILVEEVSKDDVDYKTEWFENHTGFHYKVYPEGENIYYVEDEIFEEYCYQEIVEIEGDRLGLGTNLFSNKKTLIEKVGYDKFNEEISSYSSYYMKHLLNE